MGFPTVTVDIYLPDAGKNKSIDTCFRTVTVDIYPTEPKGK